MTLPKIACLCPTYNRPHTLAESIECFQRQTLPLDRRELLILDDAGQYGQQSGPGWQIVSTNQRFRTLGEKRNATAALVSPDVAWYALWDDDDIYLPHHLAAALAVLEAGAAWCKPAEILKDQAEKRKRLAIWPATGLYHAAWSFTRDAFLSVGGYPPIQSGQDQGFRDRLVAAGITPTAPEGPPSFVYRWFSYPGARHLSHMGAMGYEQRGEEKIERCDTITPRWNKAWAKIPQWRPPGK